MPELLAQIWALGFVLFMADYLGSYENRLLRPMWLCIAACAAWFLLLPLGLRERKI
ncbi:hypothetical protein [Gilvimarinus sp. 1_MG-2023]|uniref:hypothetical protein n=1 Tax=Gilvimarinus sp. 1_MG-2023 TaxID=3062638 RepID=UPI0026E1F9D9|nr:hypothetical protein [Gilvimarinus sp. 1_MG-2023]MDO6747200.1 hypothetical protein [Gilvimarinus sp. 1_MG-2023]